MKKLMNALLLLLAIATIFSTLIIVSMADTEGGTATVADTSAVGSYTAPAGSWTPDANHAGITYGVWYGSNAADAENKFLTGTAPDYWSSSTNITATNICGATSMHRYIHLFANNLTHDDLTIYNWSSVTINLAGNTLNTATNILVGGDNINGNRDGVKLTIKNGKSYSKYPATIKTAMNTIVYYENVYFDVAKNNYEALFWDYGAKETTFKGCVIKFLGNAGMYMLGTSNKSWSSLSFINTHIEQPEAAATTPFINVSPMTDRTTVYSIRFDKDSSMNRSSDYIVNVWRNDTTSATKVNVYFEEGFECTDKSIPSMTYQVAGRGAAGTVYECTSSSMVRMAVVAPGSSTAISSWKAFYQEDGTLTLGSFENYTAAEHNANDERIVYTAWSEKEIGTAGSYLDGVRGWTVVKLYDDVTINTKGTNMYLTFDLNGHTLKLTERFEVGSQGSKWRAEYVKFISSSEIPGTLDLSSISAEKFYARPGKSLYFDNLEVNFKGTLVNDSAGLRLASFKDCNLVGTGNVVANYNVNSALADLVSWINAGNTRQYIFDNTSIPSAVPVYISNARTADRVNVTVKNGCVIGTSAAVNIDDSASGVEVSVDMSIDTKLQKFAYCAVNVDTNSAVVPVVNYKNGNETVDFSLYAMAQDGDFYVYVPRPDIDPEIVKANLTLYTDFDINFFTTAAVKGVYHKDAPIEAENYEGGNKYVVEGISPDTAADDITLIFVVEVDGIDYYLRLTYSVLKYSKTVVSENSGVSLLGKQLVSAAMEYIKSAYAYTGKTVPEFAGVEVKPSVNNAETITYLTDAIKGVQMKLDEGFRLRFNIKPEYSGKLTVGSTTYEVVNGQVGELTYVEVEIRAYKLVDSITVSDGTNTASYGLANYAKSSVVSSDAKLKAMVDALYTFCTYASEYKTSNPNLD